MLEHINLNPLVTMNHLISKLFFLLFLLFSLEANSQLLFYSDIFHGGVTGNGASFGSGSGIINMNVLVAPNSTIHRAFLIAERENGIGESITVILNEKPYIFSDTTVVTEGFISLVNTTINWDNSSMHAIDITNDIDPTINIYTLFIPPPNSVFDGLFSTYYLFISFKKSNL